jgi:hypothetical protein
LIERIVAYLKNTPVGFARHAQDFLSIQGSCTDPPEYRDLISRFVDGSIPIDSARDAQSMTLLG